MRIPKPPLLLITDRTIARKNIESVVSDAIEGGCRWIMVREKDLPPSELATVVRMVLQTARPSGATVIVNSDTTVADSCGAQGVHLPAGRSISAARRAVGRDALLGVSVHSLEEARNAEAESADYVTISPIFRSVSKPEYGDPMGLDRLRLLAMEISMPVVALGGVTPQNARDCMAAGAAGVAVLGTIMLSKDPRATTEEYVRALDKTAR